MEKTINFVNLSGMKLYPVKELAGLKKNFDLFLHAPGVDAAMLHRDLYTPLAISGDMLVWGAALLAEARKAGPKALWGVEIEGDALSLLRTALLLENRSNHYTWEEKARIYQFMLNEKLLDDAPLILPLVEERPSLLGTIKDYLGLNSVLKDFVNNRLIDMKTAKRARSLTKEVCAALGALLERFSYSRRRLFLEMLSDVKIRDGWDSAALLSFIAQLTDSPDPFAILHTHRYPQLSSMRDIMDNINKRYKGIHIKAPLNFEGDAFTIDFPIRNKEQLDQRIATLIRLSEASHELFELL